MEKNRRAVINLFLLKCFAIASQRNKVRPSRCYLLKCRGDVSASQSDTMKETKEHRSCVTVTHQTSQVHLASRQETGTYKAKTMKSAQYGRTHQTLSLWQVSACPCPGHGAAPWGSQ